MANRRVVTEGQQYYDQADEQEEIDINALEDDPQNEYGEEEGDDDG